MRTRKHAFMSALMSPYKFVMVGAAFSNRYHKFHSESFSTNLVPTMTRSEWLYQEELGIALQEDYVNGINWDFSQKGYINREH